MEDSSRLSMEEEQSINDYMTRGGCFKPFAKAVSWCHPDYYYRMCGVTDAEARGVANVEACIEATAALRRCFAGNPELFGGEYLQRIDGGLDADLNPSPEQVKMQTEERFRWWTGMRRS